MITLPAGAVAKYFDQYVCLCVCVFVREDISGTIRAILWMPVAVARSSSGVVAIRYVLPVCG